MTENDRETILDNIDGGIELIKILFQELDSDNMIIESLVTANIVLLRQTKSYIREEILVK